MAKLVMNFKSEPPEYVTPWLVRHASWLVTRFQTRSTGATAFHAQRGMPYRSTLYEFGEGVLAKIGEGKQPAKMEERWITGMWLGRSTSSDEHLIATANGIELCRSVRSRDVAVKFASASTRLGKVCHGTWQQRRMIQLDDDLQLLTANLWLLQ